MNNQATLQATISRGITVEGFRQAVNRECSNIAMALAVLFDENFLPTALIGHAERGKLEFYWAPDSNFLNNTIRVRVPLLWAERIVVTVENEGTQVDKAVCSDHASVLEVVKTHLGLNFA